MDADAIGNLVQKYDVTILIVTPTFLRHYIRRVPSRKFGSLEFVLTGAEKLPAKVADNFEERFPCNASKGWCIWWPTGSGNRPWPAPPNPSPAGIFTKKAN